MVSYRDLITAFRALELAHDRPVIAHASLSAFGEVRGGAETLLGALLASTGGVMMPTFTYKTMLTPETGPDENGITYGSGKDPNRMAEFYSPTMPADSLMGQVAERLRRQPGAKRSSHPILSFAGARVDAAVEAQTLAEPLAPVGRLAQQNGWVLLLGVDHTVNTSIHYAERLAGRRQFTRWALTSDGVKTCPGFPGCSEGFNQAADALKPITREAAVGDTLIQALPLQPMLSILTRLLAQAPLALLCSQTDCERCAAVRDSRTG